ncbi:hypothetical protein PMAYCL1PPCAC_10486, partial [Pristionchus mayeri]
IEMTEPLAVFDMCQTIIVSGVLIATIPLGCFAYCKLIFLPPYKGNYTFMLIVVNGMTNIFNGFAYLIIYQLSSFKFVYSIYKSIQELDLTRALSIIHVIFMEISLNSALFVALHRVKRFTSWKHRSETTFFYVAIASSTILSLPRILDYALFTTTS